MKKRLEIPVGTRDVARNGKPVQGDKEGNRGLGPIRKQSPEQRRAYMREYMREYRLQHPGLSTPYVRKYRAREGPEST